MVKSATKIQTIIIHFLILTQHDIAICGIGWYSHVSEKPISPGVFFSVDVDNPFNGQPLKTHIYIYIYIYDCFVFSHLVGGLVAIFLCSHILGFKSSQLKNLYFSGRGGVSPPTRYDCFVFSHVFAHHSADLIFSVGMCISTWDIR